MPLKHKLRILLNWRRGSSVARHASNTWLKPRCVSVHGNVLSIGSGDDSDGEGGKYRDYFSNAKSYITSEITDNFPCDHVLDVRNMPEIADGSYDCIFCSGVLDTLTISKAP